jgi:hypothetical protein
MTIINMTRYLHPRSRSSPNQVGTTATIPFEHKSQAYGKTGAPTADPTIPARFTASLTTWRWRPGDPVRPGPGRRR